MSDSTTNTEAELRQRLRELPRTDKFDFRYPIDAYEDDLVSLIQEETRQELEGLLEKGADMTVPDKKGNHVPWWPNGFRDVINKRIKEYGGE